MENKWQKTDWTYPQAKQILQRIDSILEQLPAAINQAHERIIGERQVHTKDKILSLYDKDVRVIVRGKMENEIELGQGLLVTEQSDGIIIDWHLFKDQPPSDNKLLKPTLERIEKYYGSIDSSCTDRGFNDKNNNNFLETKNIYNATCPRNPEQLQEKLKDPIFLRLQIRRSQTEARIGIFKNVFLGKPLRSRITAYKRVAISWCAY